MFDLIRKQIDRLKKKKAGRRVMTVTNKTGAKATEPADRADRYTVTSDKPIDGAGWEAINAFIEACEGKNMKQRAIRRAVGRKFGLHGIQEESSAVSA